MDSMVHGNDWPRDLICASPRRCGLRRLPAHATVRITKEADKVFYERRVGGRHWAEEAEWQRLQNAWRAFESMWQQQGTERMGFGFEQPQQQPGPNGQQEQHQHYRRPPRQGGFCECNAATVAAATFRLTCHTMSKSGCYCLKTIHTPRTTRYCICIMNCRCGSGAAHAGAGHGGGRAT